MRKTDRSQPVTAFLASPSSEAPAAAGASSPTAGWHAAWGLAVALGLALTLAFAGSAPLRAAAALVCGALPGAVGWLVRAPRRAVWVLATWAVGCGLAVALGGGVTGPLAPWCVAPLVAATAYGGLWRPGAVLCFALLVAVAVVQVAGGLPTPLDGALGFGLGLIGLVTILGGAAGALMLLPSPLEVSDQAPGAVAAAMPDAVDARVAAAEAGRERAEAEARGKTRFLANMSHELRTPLNAIMGFSDIMRTRLFGELSPRYGEYAQLIHESGQHLLDLINDLLDVTKIEADKYELRTEIFDVREAANAALRLLRQQADDAGVTLRGVLPAAELDVHADRRALKQIVLNLVANALKFTPRGGSVTVSFAAVAGELDIEVADTGVGIAPEDLERLGRPYEQAGDAADRSRGTGLGLSLVRAFARLHGGDMSVESRLGEGTAVTVRLPVLAAAEATPAVG